MLNRIRAGAGHWHELARLLPGLAAAGYEATTVDAETGVERRTQSRWTVSLQVLSLFFSFSSIVLPKRKRRKLAAWHAIAESRGCFWQ